MKIHGTAKGAALSTKDFGVAFSADGAPEPDYEENFDTDPTLGDWTNNSLSVSYDASAKNIYIQPADYAVSNFYGLKLDLQDVLSGSNLDNAKWVIQYTWNPYSWTENTSGSHLDCGIWIESLDPDSTTVNTNWGFKWGGGDTGGGGYLRDYCIGGTYLKAWQAFRNPVGNDQAGRAQWVSFGITPSTGSEIGVRLTRISETAFKGELYAGADFDSTPTSIALTDTALMGNIDDLRYFLIAGYLDAGSNGANQNFFDNLKIWNGINL